MDVWLRDHGFTSSQLSLEGTFKIRLGRAVRLVGGTTRATRSEARPRWDYLVRTHDGRNLFVIETKAAGEMIDAESRKQAISYARLLDDGGIAPFAIVTNGHTSEIVDSISGDIVSMECIPLDHPYVTAGFKVSIEDLSLRAEALEHLISMSPDNFLAFCCAQVSARMERLRNDDLNSGFKYIPSVYVERDAERVKLSELIRSGQKCVLILGPPQVGKTTFVCHFVEEQLSSGIPCLFYPAVGVESGLLDAIKEDFEWTFGDCSSPLQVIRHKLGSVLKRTGQKLLIFVEGLNENEELDKTLSSASERLQSEHICLILSFTTYSASRILLDPAGNPNHVAIASGVNKGDVARLDISPSKVVSDISAVYLGPFSKEERDLAYWIYSNALEVSVPRDHKRTPDPLLLRNSMERFRGRALPLTLDAEEILEATIQEKLSRLRGCSPAVGRSILQEIALRKFEGGPVSRFWLHQASACSDNFFEAALLSTRSDGSIDFYVSSERAFVIAHWVRNWRSTFVRADADIRAELTSVVGGEIAVEALRWFFRQLPNSQMLRRLGENLLGFEDARLRKLIVLCLCEYLVHLADEDRLHKKQLSDLISDGPPDLAIARSDVTKIVRDMLIDSSEDLEIRRNAAIALGRFSPELCMISLVEVSRTTSSQSCELVAHALEPGFAEIVHQILENYYGGYCPGALEGLEDSESRLAEYDDVIRTWEPTIRFFSFSRSSVDLEDLLRELNPSHKTIPDFSRQTDLFE